MSKYTGSRYGKMDAKELSRANDRKEAYLERIHYVGSIRYVRYEEDFTLDIPRWQSAAIDMAYDYEYNGLDIPKPFGSNGRKAEALARYLIDGVDTVDSFKDFYGDMLKKYTKVYNVPNKSGIVLSLYNDSLIPCDTDDNPAVVTTTNKGAGTMMVTLPDSDHTVTLANNIGDGTTLHKHTFVDTVDGYSKFDWVDTNEDTYVIGDFVVDMNLTLHRKDVFRNKDAKDNNNNIGYV